MVNGVIDADSKCRAAGTYTDQDSDYLALAGSNARPLPDSLGSSNYSCGHEKATDRDRRKNAAKS